MSTQTTNYKLTKPESEDFYDIEVFNNNCDKIDKLASGWIPISTDYDTFTVKNETTLNSKIDCTSFLSRGMKFNAIMSELGFFDIIRNVTSTTIEFIGVNKLKPYSDISGVYYSNVSAPFNCDPMIKRNPIDYTIERGTSGIWTYKKYASGYAKCWGIARGTIACDRKWGAFYTSGDKTFLSTRYPFTFVVNDKLNVQITQHYGNGNYLLMTTSTGYDKSIYSPPIQIARGTSNNSVEVVLNISVKGQLK